MKVSSIQELNQAEDDAIIYAFKAVLKSKTKYYPAKPNDAKSQSFQVATFTQGNDSIKAIFRNRDEIPGNLIGKLVYLCAYKGEKGWSGLKAKDNERDGQETERVLWVTKTAEMTLATDFNKTAQDESGSENEGGTTGQGEKPLKSQPKAKGGRSGSAAEYLGDVEEHWPDTADPESNAKKRELSQQMAWDEAKLLLGRCVNTMRLALRAAENTRALYMKDTNLNLSPEHFRVITSTFFLMLRDAEIVRWMPTKAGIILDKVATSNGEAKTAPTQTAPDHSLKVPADIPF